MKNKLSIILFLVLVVMIIFPGLCFAQDPPPVDGDPGAPIDGGASLLVGAAAVYGWKKFKERKK
jgi:hypothetical protein